MSDAKKDKPDPTKDLKKEDDELAFDFEAQYWVQFWAMHKTTGDAIAEIKRIAERMQRGF